MNRAAILYGVSRRQHFLLAASALFAGMMVAPCAAFARLWDPPAMVVLTDTLDYCDQLQNRLRACPLHTAEVAQLLKQGRQMCDHGEVRGGIAVLRRAVMLQKHAGGCR